MIPSAIARINVSMTTPSALRIELWYDFPGQLDKSASPALMQGRLVDKIAAGISRQRPGPAQLDTPSMPTPTDQPPETILDLRGIRCPHVVLRAKRALRDVPLGGTLVLECTDPLASIDVPHFVNQTGHLLTGQQRDDTLLIFRIKKQR